jgi:broad specificity phosphatase PhoE
MRNIERFVVIIALAWSALPAAGAVPVVFVVRHAEKAASGGKDPELSDAGQKRANALAAILKDAGLSGIFTTELKRTQQTAAPMANAAHLTPTIIPADDVAALAAKLRGLHGNALVVGHSSTIPALLTALGIETQVTISDDDYTELWLIVMSDHPQLVRLHYPI